MVLSDAPHQSHSANNASLCLRSSFARCSVSQFCLFCRNSRPCSTKIRRFEDSIAVSSAVAPVIFLNISLNSSSVVGSPRNTHSVIPRAESALRLLPFYFLLFKFFSIFILVNHQIVQLLINHKCEKD